MKHFLFSLALLIFVGAPSFAAETTEKYSVNFAGDGVGNDLAGQTIRPGQTFFWNPTGTGEAPVLNHSQCGHLDVEFDSNVSDALHSSVLNVDHCVSATYSANICALVANTTLTGDPATSQDVMWAIGGTWVTLRLTTLGAGDTPRAMLTCKQ